MLKDHCHALARGYDLRAFDRNGAVVIGDQPVDAAQQRCLADSVRADECDLDGRAPFLVGSMGFGRRRSVVRGSQRWLDGRGTMVG